MTPDNPYLQKTIDLHMHSTVSDGTDAPGDLLDLVWQKGIALFSLTDHDAIKGCTWIMEKMTTLRHDDPEKAADLPGFIPGVEFSCEDAYGKYHILGYGYDIPGYGDDVLGDTILEAVYKSHNFRMGKVQKRIDFLKDRFGFQFAKEDLRKLFDNHNPGKPHIAKLMVKYGFAASISDGIVNYLDKLELPDTHLHPEEAISAILGSKGIPILAHPSFGDGEQLIKGNDLRERVKYLKSMGLLGLEGYYAGFSPKLMRDVLSCAEENNMYVTAGSDYHGRNKTVALGFNHLENVADGVKGLHLFLDHISERIK